MGLQYFLLSLIPVYLYLIYRVKKAMHMLQQNWYNDGNRYLKWIKTNFKKSFNVLEIVFAVVIFGVSFINLTIATILYIILYLVLFVSYFKELKQEQSKKPLVITMRIKRLITTLFILYSIILILIMFNYNKLNIGYYYLMISIEVFISFLIVWLGNVINKPIEKQVFYHYRRLAVRKLNNMKAMKVIGITGSYGKTSSKNILNDILNIKYNSFATPKNINTPYGTINIVNNYLDKFNDIFIAEMGAFKQGEIKELCDLVKPQYGILTKIGVAHLESFGTIENIQSGKFELIESLPIDGLGILNRDDEFQVNYKLKNKCNIMWIGIDNKNVDVWATNIKLTYKGTTFDVKFKNDKTLYKFETKLLGKANIYNILAALALGKHFGLTISQLQQGVRSVSSIPHRLEMKKYGKINIIDDAYNSNPVGSKMALDVLSMMPGKKIVVTPGMIDLGHEQYNINKEFGTHIAQVADDVILVGREQTKAIYDGLIEKKFKKSNIHILNEVKQAFVLIQKLQGKETFVLLENDLPDIFNE